MKKKVIRLDEETIWDFLRENKELYNEYINENVKSRLYWNSKEWRHYFKDIIVIEPVHNLTTPLDGI